MLEWVLLVVAATVQILFAIANPNSGYPVFANLLGLAVFAAMRWNIFSKCWGNRLLFTAAEFGLLLVLTFSGNFPLPAPLYIVLTIRNYLLVAEQNTLPVRKQRSIVTILAFFACLTSQTYKLWSRRTFLPIPFEQIGLVWMGFAIVFGFLFLFLHLLVDAILAERNGQAQLAAANTRLRQYALRVEELAIAQERNRIARDLHDSLGHSLTVFNIHIGAALRLLHTDLPEAEALLLEVKDMGAQAMQEVRQSVTLLRADALQGRSLKAAISSLVKDFDRHTGIMPTVTYEIVQPLATELEFTLFRLVQESLTNICKHTAATEVSIDIQQLDREIILIVRDNGSGFDLGNNLTGFGLQGMQERTMALGGALKITTAPDLGCQIQVTFPVRS